ncbi:SepM family pheromone-processing serine protease [Streptococcus pyogenes]|uniref:SepM family pheromone-processing serine protease n=1 Tax=Streptococcus pyogenes TaxID=1314 RepID=UPI0010A1BCAD|nr:SepM family pheromone-processing serine protease [Streptococcus pyogenes]VGQ37757.1 ATP-dependent protease La [Streptococcus pyogenes]VGR03792.1 ATP-dependent protease La [Streptococcus pyogenes]VGT07302.1 ATP-dependent protease La [Streptococcus pyogenes]VHA72457.1 ATP-dependent protease La [Streptococcus pyogenes]HEP1403617.1 PDZ domain-containing protein [Streptococcus pyogenes]
MKRLKKIKWWLVGLLALISLLLALFFPLPYYIEMPGGAYDIRTVLQVNGKEDKRKGAYQFVAVGITRASLAQLLYAWLTPFTEISTAEDTTGGYSDADFLRINQFYMETSQNAAIYQALSLAGKPVTLDYKGVYVLDVNNESTFKGTLHLADTVTGVNGKQFTSSAELIDYVSHLKLGDEVTVQFTSDNKPKKGVGRIIKLKNGKNGIGIALTDHTSVNSEDTVIFSTKGVGGPSAGLMFTLDIYDQITKEDLRKGRTIAGTGTIGKDGEVGDIGGAGLKVVAAAEAGADIFFVPNNPVDKEIKKVNPNAISNYEEAKRAAKRLKTKMKIVPVTTVQEALVYLRK